MTQHPVSTEYQQALRAAEEAAEWLERLKNASPRERTEYLNWLRESPLHVRETLMATAWDVVLNDLERTHSGDEPKVDPPRATEPNHKPSKGPSPKARTQRRWTLGYALISAIFLIAVSFVLLNRATFSTELGEQRTVALPDGSVAKLNTLTTLQASYDERTRDIRLARGQAMFDVRHEAERPFIVRVGDITIRAVGTRFDVRQDASRTSIAVIEGRVRVASASTTEELSAGTSLHIDTRTHEHRRAPSKLEEMVAWQHRRLVFHDAPLNDIAAEFNRYNTTQLIVTDAAVAIQRYSGVFDANDPISFATYLAQDGSISIEHRAGVYYFGSSSIDSRAP